MKLNDSSQQDSKFRIEITLDEDYKIQFQRLKKKYGEEMFEIEGLDKESLNITNFFKKFMNSDNVANASIDDNSNVTDKNVSIMLSESRKPYNKLLSHNKIYIELKENFGKETADKWLELQINGALYSHDSHESTLKPYCFAFSLKPIVEKGLFFIDTMKAKPAQHLDTFNHHVLEFVSYATNMQSGAVGIPDYLIYAYYYWQNDVKTNYVADAEVYKKQKWQEILFNLNQPYLKGGEQSAYTNFSILDREHILGLLSTEVFPDNSLIIDHLEEIIQYQKDFLDYEREIRYEKFFTFPVISASLLFQNDKYVDEDMARFINKHNMTWQDVNIYNATEVDALSSCCFDGKQMTLTKSSDGINYMTFKEIHESSYKNAKRNFTIFHNGSWVKGKVIRLPKRNIYKIITANKKEIYITDNHINPTLNGEKTTIDLTENDYLLFNNLALDTFPEKDKNLTYEQGVLIGMYLGDGSIYDNKENNNTPIINLSLNETKYDNSLEIIKKAVNLITNDLTVNIVLNKQYNNVYPVVIRDTKIAEFIREYVFGNYSFEKELNLNCLLQSREFRQGILKGYYLTDGGNSNRIYTTSSKLVSQIECIMTSLGLNSIIDLSDRTDEKVIIREQEFNRNYPLYCIRWYDPKNKRSMENVFKIKNNNTYFKIISIEKIESSSEYVYCFEMKDKEESYFTLPNGIITHNCRLTSSLKDIEEDIENKDEGEELKGHFNSIGGSSISIGSAKVNTLNLVRIALESKGDFKRYKKILKDRVDISHKYLYVQREVLKKNIIKGLLPLYTFELLNLNRQFSTIGITGVFETIALLGGISKNASGVYYNEKGLQFAKEILNIVNEANKTTKKIYGYNANMEQIPSESCAIKICKKDKLIYGQNSIDTYIYGNQWIPLNKQCDATERVRVSSLLDKACGGGVMLHINLTESFKDEEQAWKLMNKLANEGIVYFSFISKINVCKNDHSFYGNKCPICQGEVTDSYIKIVGYLVKASSYKKERAKEMKERVFYNLN